MPPLKCTEIVCRCENCSCPPPLHGNAIVLTCIFESFEVDSKKCFSSPHCEPLNILWPPLSSPKYFMLHILPITPPPGHNCWQLPKWSLIHLFSCVVLSMITYNPSCFPHYSFIPRRGYVLQILLFHAYLNFILFLYLCHVQPFVPNNVTDSSTSTWTSALLSVSFFYQPLSSVPIFYNL